MTDLALTYDAEIQAWDLCIENGDLVLDEGLGSLAIASLMTDARAAPEDLDLGITDRRGWWGDAVEGEPTGSRLWTLSRAKTTPENERRARDFAIEALQWLIDDGIAASIDVTTARTDGDGSGATLHLTIVITRPDRTTETILFDRLWEAMA